MVLWWRGVESATQSLIVLMDILDPPAGAAAGVVPPMAPAPAPPAPGAVVVPVEVAAAQPVAGAAAAANWTKVRLRWAQMLFVLGCAAAALAVFSLNSFPTARLLGGGCAPTEAEAAALRAASELLLLAAAAQVLGATTAVLLPACQLLTVFATFLGWFTGYCASYVLWLLVACHGHVHGARLMFYCFFIAIFILAFLVGFKLSLRGPCLELEY